MSLSPALSADIQEIRERFFSDPIGYRAEVFLSRRLDRAILDLWEGQDAGRGFAALAVGGYGRETLHPQSDLDLLLFFRDEIDEHLVRKLLTPVWDLGFRVGHQVRQASDFRQMDPSQMESYTAFLDARFLFGDPAAARALSEDLLPGLIARNRERFLEALVQMKARRYRSHGHTVFQLEPDLKTAPGGLRDHQWVRWVSPILGLSADGALDESVRLLYRIRNFLHFMSGRDQNVLTYEFQEQVADRLGYADSSGGAAPEHLMKDYFLCAQAVAHRARALEKRIIGPSDEFDPPAPGTVSACLDAFAEAHRKGVELGTATLERVRACVGRAPAGEMATKENGEKVLELMRNRRGISGLLRRMHEVGLLGGVFPEFERIRCRVIRDYFHKYTVDEHSLIAIGNIEALDHPGRDEAVSPGLSRVLDELEHPELLLLSLLLHDIGKSARHAVGDHACSSVEMLDGVLERLSLPSLHAKRVRKAVQNHLEMSKIVMRRDLSDPAIVRQFADLVGTQEDLRMLYLLTYADMKAVSPDVWTSWKGDLLWQLYLATFEYLRHGLIEERFTGEELDAEMATVEDLLRKDGLTGDYRPFLEGFPKQYLRNTPTERVAALVRKYLELSQDRPVVTDWSRNGELWEVLVMTQDRPELFARVTGALASFGLNVVRADAFSNRKKLALDLVAFEDPDSTLTRNPTERERFDGLLKEVVVGSVSVEKLLRRRSTSVLNHRGGRRAPLQVLFDRSVARCTIVEIVAPDDIGLLFKIARAVSGLGCNIEIALVATEGQRAIDVFYLTQDGGQLGADTEARLRRELEGALETAEVAAPHDD